MQQKNVLERVQQLPEFARRVILWALVLTVAVGMFAWQIGRTQERIQSVSENTQFPEFDIPKPTKYLPDVESFPFEEIDLPPELEESDELRKTLEDLLQEYSNDEN